MPDDENQQPPAKAGPRHAAPRKSLLTRIQGPAGKAMALAAMPTAVFVGMGLTPRLALADDKDLPFAPGPCVTRSDEPVAEETPEPTGPAKPKPTGTPSATATPTTVPTTPAATEPTEDESEPESDTELEPESESGTETDPESDTGSDTESGSGTSLLSGARPGTAPTTTAATSSAPAPARSRNPLDPLGVGDALHGLFDGLAPKPTATPPTVPTPTTVPTATAVPPTKPAKPAKPATPDDGPTASTAPKPGPTTRAPEQASGPAAEKTRAAIEKAADAAGVKAEELPEDVRGLDPRKDESIPEGAKPRFPCPVRDEEALAAAELEPGIPLLPDQPWRLESTRLTLIGLKYHGIVEVKTGSGKIKKVLKFTATTVKIKDLHQLTDHPSGLTAHVRSDRGKESTITEGTVTMYTEELKGRILGFPITFSPEAPPPLDIPVISFTDVKLKQAGQFGGTLRVPGLRNTIEPN
ncbi:hypothetical protein [Streptomyces sp. NPDC094049]|uniref:hypothetical protein n=1 Tax=Streptomyces sp. NPDC094049 TaxID=3154987 RepID=UPI0033283212